MLISFDSAVQCLPTSCVDPGQSAGALGGSLLTLRVFTPRHDSLDRLQLKDIA